MHKTCSWTNTLIIESSIDRVLGLLVIYIPRYDSIMSSVPIFIFYTSLLYVSLNLFAIVLKNTLVLRKNHSIKSSCSWSIVSSLLFVIRKQFGSQRWLHFSLSFIFDLFCFKGYLHYKTSILSTSFVVVLGQFIVSTFEIEKCTMSLKKYTNFKDKSPCTIQNSIKGACV